MNYFTPPRLLQLFAIPFVVVISILYSIHYGISEVLRFFVSLLSLWWLFYLVGVPKKGLAIYLGIGIVGACTGYMLMERAIDEAHHEKDYFVGSGIYCEGTVQDVTYILHDEKEYLKILFQPTRLWSTKESASEGKEEENLGRLYLYVEQKNPIEEGDHLLFKGKVEPISYSYEEGAIDTRARYAGQSIVGTVWDPTIQSFTKESPTFLWRLQQQGKALREYWEGLLYNHVGEREGSILSALLFGAEYSKLPEEVNESFAVTGLIHMLSVSGSHIALLLGLTVTIGRGLQLPKRYVYGVSMVVIIGYAGMVGLSSPVWRASFAGILCAIGMSEDRPYSAIQALLIMAILQLLTNPFLVQDISFQLSYGATLGILIFYGLLMERFHVRPRWLRASLALTVAAQVIVLPFQLYYFHQISWISLLANLLVGACLELVMAGSFVILLLESVTPYLSSLWQFVFSMIAHALQYTLQLDAFLASLPFAVQEIGHWGMWELSAYTSAWILVFLYMKRRIEGHVLIFSCVALIACVSFFREIAFRPELLVLSHPRLQVVGIEVEGKKGIFFVSSDFPGLQERDPDRLNTLLGVHHITEAVVFLENDREMELFRSYFEKTHRGIKRHLILRKFESLQYSYKGIEVGIQGPFKNSRKNEFSAFSRYFIRCQGKERGFLVHSGQGAEKVVQLKDNKEWISIGIVPSEADVVMVWPRKGSAYEDPAEPDTVVIGREKWTRQFL